MVQMPAHHKYSSIISFVSRRRKKILQNIFQYLTITELKSSIHSISLEIYACWTFTFVLLLSMVELCHLHQALKHVINSPHRTEIIIRVPVFQMINVFLKSFSWDIYWGGWNLKNVNCKHCKNDSVNHDRMRLLTALSLIATEV